MREELELYISTEEPFDFGGVADDLVKFYNLSLKGKFIWNNPADLTTNNLRVCTPEVKERFTKEYMLWQKSGGHSFLEIVIQAAISLGMEQQARIINQRINECENTKRIINKKIELSESYIARLKECIKN
jgi:hypothetical protein